MAQKLEFQPYTFPDGRRGYSVFRGGGGLWGHFTEAEFRATFVGNPSFTLTQVPGTSDSPAGPGSNPSNPGSPPGSNPPAGGGGPPPPPPPTPTVTSDKNVPKAQTSLDPNNVNDIITQSMIKAGINPQYWWIPQMVSYGESGWRPDAIGKEAGGAISVGLFQIHDVHEIPVEQRKDPVYNADWIMDDFKANIDAGVAQGLQGADLFEYVWLKTERPEDTPAARQRMRSVYDQFVSGQVALPSYMEGLTGGGFKAGSYAGGSGATPGGIGGGSGSGFGSTDPYLAFPGAPDLSGYQALASIYEGIGPWIESYIGLTSSERDLQASGAASILAAMREGSSQALEYAKLASTISPDIKHASGWGPGGPAEALYKATGHEKDFNTIAAPQVDVDVPGWINQLGGMDANPLLAAMMPDPLDVESVMNSASDFARDKASWLPPFLQPLVGIADDMYSNPPPDYMSNPYAGAGGLSNEPEVIPGYTASQLAFMAQNGVNIEDFIKSQFDPSYLYDQFGGLEDPTAAPTSSSLPNNWIGGR